jgi:hypothetical protein
MPHFFSTGNYQTFQRNLNLWGFRTVSKGIHKGECSNPNFQKDRPELCSNLARIRIKSFPNDAMSAQSIHSTTSWQQQPQQLPGPGQPPQQQSQQPQLHQLMDIMSPSGLSQEPPPASQHQSFNVMSMLISALVGGSLCPEMLGNPDALAAIFAIMNNLQASSNRGASVENKDVANAFTALATTMGGGEGVPLDALAGFLGPQQSAQAPSNVYHGLTGPLLALQQQQLQNATPAPDVAASHKHPQNSVQLSSVARTAATSDVSSATSTSNSPKQQCGGMPKELLSAGDMPVEMPLIRVVNHKQDREAAMRRGSRVIPCRARGMPMDHSGHVSFLVGDVLSVLIQ